MQQKQLDYRLVKAVQHGSADDVAFLLRQGANADARVGYHENCLWLALGRIGQDTRNRDAGREIARLLIASGADVNARLDWLSCPSQISVVYSLAALGDAELLRAALARGGSVGGGIPSMPGPVAVAAVPHIECLKLLVRAGADVLARDSHGLTALDHARRLHNAAAIRVLEAAEAAQRRLNSPPK